MMKTIAIICVACLILAFGGCAQTQNYQVLTFDYSDSVDGSSFTREYNYWSEENIDVSGVKSVITVDVNGEQHTGIFDRVHMVAPNSYPVYQYTDNNDNTFTVDPDGKLASYFWESTKGDNQNKLSEEDCAEIAKEFLKKVVDVELYQLKTEYSSEQGHYQFIFTKYIDGYKTADSARVTVKENGDLYIFSSTMLGKIPMDVQIDFDNEKVEKAVFKKLDAEYAGVKSKYDKVAYKIVNKYVTILESGDVAMVCTVEVDCITKLGEYYSHLGNRVGFVIGRDIEE